MTTEYSSRVYVNGCEERVRFLLNLPLADCSLYFLLGDLSAGFALELHLHNCCFMMIPLQFRFHFPQCLLTTYL